MPHGSSRNRRRNILTYRVEPRTALQLPRLFVLICFSVVGLCSQSRAQTCSPPNCWTGDFYQYEIVAQTSETTSVGTLTGLGVSPSINENGSVAFMGQVSSGGQSLGNTIFFGNAGSSDLTVVAPNYLNTRRTFDQAVQINNKNQIVAQDRFSGAPPSYFLRIWDGNNPNLFTLVAKATGSSDDIFSAILGSPAMNASNNVAFSALDLKFDQMLADTNLTPPPPINTTPLSTPLRPMISDQNQIGSFPIVVRGGNTDTSPIVLYPNSLTNPVTIADTSTFNKLGQSPGISRDGVVVAFAGDLNKAGATKYNTNSGPGVFAAVVQKGQVSNVVRIAGFQTPSPDCPKKEGAHVGTKCVNSDAKTNLADQGLPWCDHFYLTACQALLGELEDIPPFESPTRIFFQTFTPDGFNKSTEWENRIAVAHVDFGASGIDGDTIVVSFIATPNMGDSSGLNFFTNQQGIWTVRADLILKGTNLVSHVYRPIPVIQVGDDVGSTGAVVASLAVYDQLANIVPVRANGDHRVAFWISTTNGGQMILRGSYIRQYGGSVGNAALCCTAKNGSTGTVGALVSQSSTLYMLSAAHVFADPESTDKNGAKKGDLISMPGRYDYACEKKVHTVGKFSYAPPLSSGVDAAIAELNPGEINSTGQIYGIGIPANTILPPTAGLAVAKQGRTTGLTCGNITALHASMKPIGYTPCKGKPFDETYPELLVIGSKNGPFDSLGDSGALVVSQSTAQPVALLIGGSIAKPFVGYALPMDLVANQLGVAFVGGSEHTVPSCPGGRSPQEVSLSQVEVERANEVKKKYASYLMEDPAVLGVGIGAADDNPTQGTLVVVIESGKKYRPIPPMLEGLRTKIMFSGPVKAAGGCETAPER
jgi:hypothetical protein